MMSDDEVSHVSRSTGLCTFMEDTPLNRVRCIHRLCSLPLGLNMLLHGSWFYERHLQDDWECPESPYKHKMKKRKSYTNSKQTYFDTKTLVQSCRNTKISIKKYKMCNNTVLEPRAKVRSLSRRLLWVISSCPYPPSVHSRTSDYFVPSWFDQYLCPCWAKSQVPE